MKDRLTIAFDFDGVLAQYDGWKGFEVLGDPIDGMKELLDDLKNDHDHIIIIYTTRGNAEISAWCSRHNIIYDYINSNPNLQGNNPGKPIADVYVDDRSIRFDPENLQQLEQQIINFKPWWRQ